MSVIRVGPEALADIPALDVLGLIASHRLRIRCGHCAGCNHEFAGSETPATWGMWSWPDVGTAYYNLCGKCEPRARGRKFRSRIRNDAYRSLFRAGPDDVAGTA